MSPVVLDRVCILAFVYSKRRCCTVPLMCRESRRASVMYEMWWLHKEMGMESYVDSQFWVGIARD